MAEPNPTVIEIQETPTYCFPACLRSYLKGIGIQASQREIVERNRNEFRYGTAIEGAMAPDRLAPVMKTWGLKHRWLRNKFDIHPREAVLLTLYWGGDRSSRHWVRYLGRDSEDGCFVLMEPSGHNPFPAKITADQYNAWEGLAFKVSVIRPSRQSTDPGDDRQERGTSARQTDSGSA